MKEFNLKDYTLPGDSDNSSAIRNALEDLRKAGGGLLRVQKGEWRTLPIELSSNSTLFLEEGAHLNFIPDFSWGLHPLILADSCVHVHILGQGSIDGGGGPWWKEPSLHEDYSRPHFVQFKECDDVSIEDITVQNSPCWTIHPLFSRNVTIRGLTIKNPKDSPNTDAIDLDSCENALIENCKISVGDDAVTIKAGRSEEGNRAGKSCKHVTVRRCSVESAHGGVVMGSETCGGIEDVDVSDCNFHNTDRGMRIKTRRGRGGGAKNIRFRHIRMEGCLCPLTVNMYYRCGNNEDWMFGLKAQPVTDTTPHFDGIYIEDVVAKNCRASAGIVAGLAEAPVTGLELHNVAFSVDLDNPASPDLAAMAQGLPPAKGKGFRMFNVKNPVFENLHLTDLSGKALAQAFIYE
jgi:polygalacturonase